MLSHGRNRAFCLVPRGEPHAPPSNGSKKRCDRVHRLVENSNLALTSPQQQQRPHQHDLITQTGLTDLLTPPNKKTLLSLQTFEKATPAPLTAPKLARCEAGQSHSAVSCACAERQAEIQPDREAAPVRRKQRRRRVGSSHLRERSKAESCRRCSRSCRT